MDLLDKIKNLFTPADDLQDGHLISDDEPNEANRPEEGQPKVAREPKPSSSGIDLGDNSVEAREHIIESITNELKPLRGRDEYRELEVYVLDPKLRPLMQDEGFKQQLRLALDNCGLESLGSGNVKVTPSDPRQEGAFPALNGALQLVVRKEIEELPTAKRLRLAVYGGMGSMAEAEYVLDASQKQVFHIGRSRVVKQGGPPRVNDIIIRDDEPDEALLQANRHVSRSHADIVYRDGRFYIKAMPGGCRAMGNAATKVYHGEKVEELADTNTLKLLCDGDLIELGKEVILHVSVAE